MSEQTHKTCKHFFKPRSRSFGYCYYPVPEWAEELAESDAGGNCIYPDDDCSSCDTYEPGKYGTD